MALQRSLRFFIVRLPVSEIVAASGSAVIGSLSLVSAFIVDGSEYQADETLAFNAKRLVMSAKVISLCLLFVISSAASHHVCISGKGSLSITL